MQEACWRRAAHKHTVDRNLPASKWRGSRSRKYPL